MATKVSGMTRDEWFRLGAGSLIMVVLGAVVTLVGTGAFGGSVSSDFNVAYSYAGAGQSEALPLKVDKAEDAGWSGSIRCLQAQGRFYRKLSGDQADPVMLLYNAGGGLIGVSIHSPTEQPRPWLHQPEGILGVQGRQAEYWDLSLYFSNPLNACGIATGGSDFVFHAIYP